MAEEKKHTMTTDAGRPVGDNQNSLTVGPRGPVVFRTSCFSKRWLISTVNVFPSGSCTRKARARPRLLCLQQSRHAKVHNRKAVFGSGKEDADVSTFFDCRR